MDEGFFCLNDHTKFKNVHLPRKTSQFCLYLHIVWFLVISFSSVPKLYQKIPIDIENGIKYIKLRNVRRQKFWLASSHRRSIVIRIISVPGFYENTGLDEVLFWIEFP